MTNIIYQLQLEALISFLTEQASEYNAAATEELGTVLSDMSIYTWIDGKPANPKVWYDWKKNINQIIKKTKKDQEISLDLKKMREKSFVSGFKFLNEVFWKKNNNITIEQVIQTLQYCLNCIEQQKINALWFIWTTYLDAEKDKEYSFD